jgi:asparagine synthase (glutamine-hydrolysing)
MELFFHLKSFQNEVRTIGEVKVSLGDKNCNVFSEWDWNGEKLTLTNDRYGFYPIYYFCRENEFAVSPSLNKLLELSNDRKFDENAFAVFLRLGWLIGEDTLFASIRALPPGSVLTWQNNKLSVVSQGNILSNPINISRQDAIKTYSELFQKAIEKTLPENENVVVPLSGGRDSRHILLALCEAQKKPAACLTIIHPPPRPNEDARIARQICEILNLRHLLIEQSNSRFESEIRKNQLTGFSVYEHGWFLALGDFIKGQWQTIYDGIAGDVLSAGLFLNEERLKLFRQERFDELADKLLEPEGYIPKLLKKDFYQKLSREKAINHLSKELARHADQPNPVGSFYFWNRTRRCIAPSPFRLLGDSINIITPYLETELFDFLSSLSADLFLDHQFHTDTIAFAYPEFADIPYEKKDSPLISDSGNFKKFSRDIFNYSLTSRNRTLINRMFFLTRLLRGVFDKNYNQAVTEFGEQAINLLQLERL